MYSHQKLRVPLNHLHYSNLMTQLELQQYLLREFPQENARCEWKEF